MSTILPNWRNCGKIGFNCTNWYHQAQTQSTQDTAQFTPNPAHAEFDPERKDVSSQDLDASQFKWIVSGNYITLYYGELKAGQVGVYPAAFDRWSHLFWASFPGRDWSGTCFLTELWVAPPFRRHGLGVMLVNKAMESARYQGCHTVALGVHDTNQVAKRLYERTGFKETDRFSGKLTGNVLMERPAS